MSEALTINDYKEVFEDHKRLVRELDVLMNGLDGAARQASLCDIVAQFPDYAERVFRDGFKAGMRAPQINRKQ